MKTLQNNFTFTTPEQSKRLLELGVPADSADFRQPKDNGLDGKEYIIFYNMFPFSKEVESTIFDGDNLLPCWSIGRLIEIMLNSQIDTGTYTLGFILDKDTFSIESLIDIIDEDMGEFDFSKLKD